VPKPRPGQRLHLDKLSKRQEDDISAVCLALRLTLVDGQVQDARVGVGGVAATPLRAHAAEAALRGQPWNPATALAAGQALAQSVQPISDMRASADYRRQMLRALMQRAQARDAIGEVQDLMQVLPSTGEAA
jgi:xanthine dehydrogenase small subunit